MKAIISHDIDHITVSEHFFSDLIVPKFIIRSKIELLSGKISISEFVSRIGDFGKNKWHNVGELIAFNKQNNIPSSFFLAAEKGTGLNYSNSAAIQLAKLITENNCDLNIHGIQFGNYNVIAAEREKFKTLFNFDANGIRMHYVKRNADTLSNFSTAGYLFDSTEHSFKNPYKIGNMWEFPFQIMDGWVIENGKKWQSRNLKQSKEATKQIIDKCHSSKLDYIGIDFHDRYFSKSFKTWLDWYVWLTEYLKTNDIKATSFNAAIKELESVSLLQTK